VDSSSSLWQLCSCAQGLQLCSKIGSCARGSNCAVGWKAAVVCSNPQHAVACCWLSALHAMWPVAMGLPVSSPVSNTVRQFICTIPLLHGASIQRCTVRQLGVRSAYFTFACLWTLFADKHPWGWGYRALDIKRTLEACAAVSAAKCHFPVEPFEP
jgi:hypothetical protein